MKNISLYVGCGLTHAPEEFKENVEWLKVELEKVVHVLDFFGLKNVKTATDVYRHDINYCVKNCDLMIAICDEPSLGLGYEMATQIEFKGKPTLAVAHYNSNVSRLISGIDKSNFEFRRYKDFNHLYHIILEKLQNT